jgi:hypothetical protein
MVSGLHELNPQQKLGIFYFITFWVRSLYRAKLLLSRDLIRQNLIPLYAPPANPISVILVKRHFQTKKEMRVKEKDFSLGITSPRLQSPRQFL